MAMQRKSRWIWTGIAAAAAVGLLAWVFMPKPVVVDTAPVLRGAFEKTVDEDGKTRVRDRYVVSAPLAGRVLRVGLKPGAEIARGTVVATLVPAAPMLLDARTEQELSERVGIADAEQQRADSSVERARVALDLARSELVRQRDLATRGFTSQQALERAEREFQLKEKEVAAAEFGRHAAEHQRSLARAALTRARSGRGTMGERWDIRSPVDGRVLRVAQESEAVVTVGAPILDIGDPRNLEIVVDVLSGDAATIAPGAQAWLDIGNGARPLQGRVRLIEPSAFTKVSALGVEEQRVNVVIDLAAPQDPWSRLGDGYRVDARIVVMQQTDAVLVPVGAVFRHHDGWAAYVLENGRARLHAIDLGPRNATHALVLGGLAPGEQVIVYPSDAIGDAVRVNPRRP